MKKTHKRWLAAALAAVMLSSGVVASADGLPKLGTQADTQASTQVTTQADTQTESKAINLATLEGVVATDSNHESGPNYNNNADKAKDGDTTSTDSRWATINDSDGTTERWLQYNLGEIRTITSFKVYWEATNAKEYYIETSNDGKDWKAQVTKNEKPSDKTMTYDLAAPVEAQYVRLRVAKYDSALTTSTWYNISVYEFEVYGYEEVAPTIGNLARLDGVEATDSDHESGSGYNNNADKAKDGDTTSKDSRWATNNDSDGTTERWLQYNLGEIRTITGFKVYWEATNAKEYYIETSNDGKDWKAQVTKNEKPSDKTMTYELSEPVEAQYVRLRVAKYDSALTDTVWYNISVYEFEVLGHMPAGTTTPDEGEGEVVTLPKGTNIARLDSVTASASNEETKDLTAAKAKDGDKTGRTSRWATVQNAKTPTITYNLGATYNVGSVILYWENNNPIKWHVETSMDNQKWDTQATFTEKLTLPTAPIQTVNFPEIVEARYVRVRVEDYKGTNWNNVSMYEFEVYQEESEEVVTPATAAATLAQTIQINGENKVVMTGEVPEKYTATWGCNYEQVVGADGTIYTPLVDTTVEISVTVREKDDTTVAGSHTVELKIPGVKTANEGNAKPAVIPELAQWYSSADQVGKVFTLTANTRIVADAKYNAVAKELQADIRDLFGLNLSIVTGTAQAGDISLVYGDQGGFDKETYNMVVTDQVVIQAKDATGAYWGTRSVLQALKLSGNATIAQGTACDYPEFENRGFMLDVGRKPTSMETLKNISKTMSWFKMNSFHVHLSDNLIFMENYVTAGKEAEAWNSYQGFRLESDKEGLTSTDYYYTKEEFKDFMAYSRALGVDIVPEIDVPAHALSITNYIKNVLKRPDLVLNKKGGDRPWFDHVDISKPEAVTIIKGIFDEYIECGIYDENTIVHIGADEFYDSHPAYRNFLKEMIDYITDQGRQVRVWGSLTQMSGGTGSPFTTADVQGAQMNIWNTSWANPQQMFNLGFDLINTIDGYLYMVPNGNGKQGGYQDFLHTQSLYTSWEPENYGGTWIPSGSSQMLGACYAIWQDNIDTKAAGINETDTFTRFADALPYLGVKMWGTGGDGNDRSYNDIKADVATLGTAPNTNPYHTIDLAAGANTYMQYTFSDTQDRSGNGRNLALGPNASLADGALVLSGGSSYATTGLDVTGPKNTITMRVYKDSKSNTGEQILMEADAAYGDHMITALAQNNGKWKLGFSRELYDYVFDYELPCDEWVTLTITNEGNKTYLVVGEKKVAAVGSFLPDEHATTEFMGKTGIEYSSFDLPVARIGSKTNAFVGKVDDVMCYANGVTPTTNYLVSFDTDGGNSIAPVAVANGAAVAAPTAPTKDGYTFKGWYTDKTYSTEYTFGTAVTADITLYAKWEKNSTPVDPTDPGTKPTDPGTTPTDKPQGNVTVDNNSGVTVTVGNADQVFAEGTVITVESITEGQVLETVKEALKDVVADLDKTAVLDITAMKDNAVVQPDGKVQMTFAIPEHLSADHLKLFYVSDDGKTVEEIQITVDKDAKTVTANLEHFSTYVLANVVADDSSVPSTGDNSAVMLYVVALAASMALLAGAVVVSRKRKA